MTHGPVGTIMAATSGPVGKVLQIHFQYDITSDEYRAAATSLADTFAQLDGCAGRSGRSTRRRVKPAASSCLTMSHRARAIWTASMLK
ncbi:MAG: hypothetical protein R3A10_05620 [Caldilineaceae bacterium]